MKNIKLFKYIKTKAFRDFLTAYGYKLENVKGFSYYGQKHYQGNVLKLYKVNFKDGEYEYFKVVTFKDFNEYNQARLNFGYEKLSSWYSSAWVIKYKTKHNGLYNVTD